MTTPLPVIITPNAAEDLTASWVWLSDRNPRAADEYLDPLELPRHQIAQRGAMEQQPVSICGSPRPSRITVTSRP